MSDQAGRHAAQGDNAVPPHASAPGSPAGSTSDSADEAFARPGGVDGGFAPHDSPPSYTPPPPTASPAERAVFGRPADAGSFAPAPGERLRPQPHVEAPVPRVFSETFGAPADARDGFAPAPGSRLAPSGRAPQSPWWKPDARRDPWRDPAAPFWLGRGAIFTRGAPAQLDPDEDTLADDDLDAGAGDTDDAEDLEQDRTVRRVRFGVPTIVATLVIALVAGVIGGGVGWFITDHSNDALHRPDASIAQVQTPVKRPSGSVAGVAKRVGPAVVSIAVKTPSEFAIGSGVVIDSHGDVLTNNHVVASAAGVKNASIVVTFSNEATAKAQIVGRDPTSDLAVIKVPDQQLTVASLGDSSKIAVGDQVLAIGSPLGLQGTVTEGIVSALNRPVKAESDNGTSAYLSAIQTDAPINPGNSGGALVNSSGAVIGINSAGRFSTSDPSGDQIPISGIGYAIPINHARDIATQLIRTGKVDHAAIGAQGVTALAGLQVGAYVKQVSPGGPAAKAGLQPGDVVVVADRMTVQTFDQLVVIVQQHKPGDRIQVTYYRGSDKRTTTVTLGKG
ncbi:S1C family serine protease [uncultured Jatrophihabitans sp.]|uniref:S1C family serine protease n=1 Tax=uncultured Jatrophihabitans sp. TaxID=1610747 RepID=UPI0035CC1B3B